MTVIEKNTKRAFDIFFSCIGLLILGWFILITALISKIFIGGKGFFLQKRVGQYGKLFTIYKIETINPKLVQKNDYRVSKLGNVLRNSKIDEFPQLFNVLKGEMSFVGPRPDLPGFADKLTGEARRILEIKPGITGPASIHFRNEEKLLQKQKNAAKYNREVIWPQKVAINLKYVREYSLAKDIYYIYKTLF